MFVTVSGIKIFYERSENGGTPVVLLHGWGASGAAMGGVHRYLSESGYSVLTPDLPGFGQSGLPPDTWGVYDYADLVAELLRRLQIEKPAVVGHSFGGRLGIILGARGLTCKLLLTDAAGVKPRFRFKKTLRIWTYKLKKKFGRTSSAAGSADYRALPESMKPVFVRVVNQHLDSLLPQIRVPTLLVWGDADAETPMYMAKKLNKRIPDSGLAVLKGCGHFAYAENYDAFLTIADTFLKSRPISIRP